MLPDIGNELVEHVRAILGVDAGVSNDEPAGFQWWPWRLPQRVWAERSRGGTHVRVHAESRLLRGDPGTGVTFAALAEAIARDPGLSGPRWNGDTGDVTLHAAVTLPTDPDRLGFGRAAALLAHAAVLQLGDAERWADALAGALAATRADATPPGRPPRAEPDALLEAADVYALRGAKPTPWSAEVLQSFATLSEAPWSRVNAAAGRFDAELPDASAPTPAEGTALLRMSGVERHPRLGAGLLVMMQPPASVEPVPERRAATAALLGEAEAREWLPAEGPWSADALGGWCVHPQHGLAHVAFFPALADRPDLLESIARGAALRARWVRGFLAKVAAMRDGGAARA